MNGQAFTLEGSQMVDYTLTSLSLQKLDPCWLLVPSSTCRLNSLNIPAELAPITQKTFEIPNLNVTLPLSVEISPQLHCNPLRSSPRNAVQIPRKLAASTPENFLRRTYIPSCGFLEAYCGYLTNTLKENNKKTLRVPSRFAACTHCGCSSDMLRILPNTLRVPSSKLRGSEIASGYRKK